MDRRVKTATLAVALVVAASLLLWVRPQRFFQPRFQADPALGAAFASITEDFRKIIVLMDGAESLDDALRARCVAAGRQIFWRKQRAIDQLDQRLSQGGSGNGVRQFIQYLTTDGGLHDADKLAFLDIVEELDTAPAGQVPAPRNPRNEIGRAHC